MGELTDPDSWCGLGYLRQRELLAAALESALASPGIVRAVTVEAGRVGQEYDLTAAVQTDVGHLRTALWSHARASIFCDPSVHPANRANFSPARAVEESAERLRRRLEVPFTLEPRGLTVTLSPEEGVERVWTAERSRFRNRTAVTREDRVMDAADVDVRDLLAHFYVGPSLRLVSAAGEAFLLPAGSEAEGPLLSLCPGGRHWTEGAHESCPTCGGVTDVVIAARPPQR